MMIFTRRFGALAARPQFPDAPELQQEAEAIAEFERELAQLADENRTAVDESAA